MSMIETRFEGNLQIFIVHGCIYANEAIAIIDEHYSNNEIEDFIWDFTNASNMKMTYGEFVKISDAAKVHADNRVKKIGKIALVGNDFAEYGLLNVYTKISALADSNIQYNVFKTVIDARQWLSD